MIRKFAKRALLSAAWAVLCVASWLGHAAMWVGGKSSECNCFRCGGPQ